MKFMDHIIKKGLFNVKRACKGLGMEGSYFENIIVGKKKLTYIQSSLSVMRFWCTNFIDLFVVQTLPIIVYKSSTILIVNALHTCSHLLNA